MPVPALLQSWAERVARPFRAVERAAVNPTPTSGYVLPLGGGVVPTDWPINYWQAGYDPLSGGGGAVVYACIAAYAQTVAMCPGSHWRSTGDGGRERVTNSALSRILRRPNTYQSPSDFFLYLTDCLYRQGEAFGLALRNARFEIAEIHLMDPRFCYARVATTGDLFYTLGGNQIIERLFGGASAALRAVPARDVLHVRLPNPTNPLKGMPPLEAAMLEHAASTAIVSQDVHFAANQARPSGVIETQLQLTPEQIKELRASWDLQTKGVNQGGTPILGWGMSWKPAIMTARDAQLAEKTQINDQKIATAYRVPLPLLSLFGSQGGPQASTESLMQFWVATGLGFAANHIEDAFGLLFDLKGQPDEYMELDFAMLLRAAYKDRIEGLARGVQGGIYAPNEARALEELPAMPFGEEPRVQQQVVPLSAWAQAPPATPAPPAPDAPPPGEPNAGGNRQLDWARLIFAAADRHDRRA